MGVAWISLRDLRSHGTAMTIIISITASPSPSKSLPVRCNFLRGHAAWLCRALAVREAIFLWAMLRGLAADWLFDRQFFWSHAAGPCVGRAAAWAVFGGHAAGPCNGLGSFSAAVSQGRAADWLCERHFFGRAAGPCRRLRQFFWGCAAGLCCRLAL